MSRATAALIATLLAPLPALAGPQTGEAVNSFRLAKGLPALTYSADLEQAAQGHAAELARRNSTSHKGRDGSDHMTRIARTGFALCRGGKKYGAENIAYGFSNLNSVIKAWSGSSGHYKNLTTRKATHYGLGHAGDKWVLVVARAC
ncbi:CAP domain-containing protein [Alphaproteobacteria bacterium KMM 3653]|uniref:CAP domain-containing protein n=1 Tax=Harenicola maris TaxID=2841044 RepID=A0AAP2CSK1_9RHOB|nr:CAP domain-containing protein [Harenicola maris]